MITNLSRKSHRYNRYLTKLKGLSKKKTVQAYTFLILSLLTIAFFIASAIRPTLRTIASLVAEIKVKKEIEEQLEDKINALAVAKANYQNFKEDLPLVEQSLPNEAEFSLLMIQIEVLAFKNNLLLEKEDFKDISLIFDSEIKIQFQLQAKGDYQDLKNFVSDLEKLRRLTVLEALNFEKPREAELQVLSLKLEAEVQSLKQ